MAIYSLRVMAVKTKYHYYSERITSMPLTYDGLTKASESWKRLMHYKNKNTVKLIV